MGTLLSCCDISSLKKLCKIIRIKMGLCLSGCKKGNSEDNHKIVKDNADIKVQNEKIVMDEKVEEKDKDGVLDILTPALLGAQSGVPETDVNNMKTGAKQAEVNGDNKMPNQDVNDKENLV